MRPLSITVIDSSLLAPSPDRSWFNPSLTRLPGSGSAPSSLLLAYRVGQLGSHIHLARLDASTLQPVWNTPPLVLSHPMCVGGREDPRLFWHRGQLHMAFTGVHRSVSDPNLIRTSQLLSRFPPLPASAKMATGGTTGPQWKPEAVWMPHYPGRQDWEKNWAFFSSGPAAANAELYSVYDTARHTVLHLPDPPHQLGSAFLFSQLPDGQCLTSQWSGGLMRGGASPVLSPDGREFWHFFHGCQPSNGSSSPMRYSLGLLTFDAAPPFRPLRLLRQPLLWPDDSSAPRGWGKSVVFPCGALFSQSGAEPHWLVSYGVHDSAIHIARFSHAALESALSPLA